MTTTLNHTVSEAAYLAFLKRLEVGEFKHATSLPSEVTDLALAWKQTLKQGLDESYYGHNVSVASDAFYDALVRDIKATQTIQGDETTLKPGHARQSAFDKIAHNVPMLSIDNAFTTEEFDKFLTLVRKEGADKLVAEFKIDGLALKLTYRHGRLISAATRGDGETGEDVTENAKRIKSIPKTLDCTNPPATLVVEGEVFMSYMTFQMLNSGLMDKCRFVDVRSAASGSLRQSDPNVTEERNLTFFAYGISEVDEAVEPKTQADTLRHLVEYGFTVDSSSIVINSDQLAHETFKHFVQQRMGLGYAADGVVFKVNDRSIQKRMGHTSHHVRWAIAYKFADEVVSTRLLSITNTVGRTGCITPVASVEPVGVGGVIVTSVNLHNYAKVKRLKLCIDDVVYLTRAGGAVPDIRDAIRRTDVAVPVPIPTNCPSCSSLLVRNVDTDELMCVAKSSCPGQAIERLLHFSSKQGLNMPGVGRDFVTKAYYAGHLRRVEDFFTLDEEKVASLDGYSGKNGSKLLASIRGSRHNTLARFLVSLGVDRVGKEAANRLVAKYVNLTNIINAAQDGSVKISREGGAVEAAVCAFFTDADNIKTVEELVKHGVLA